MSELLTEKVVPLGKLAKAACGPSGSVNASTVFRWCKVGVRGADGTRVKLEHVRVGGRLFSTLEAYGRFIARLSANEMVDTTPPARTPAERRRASEKAAKELEAMGA